MITSLPLTNTKSNNRWNRPHSINRAATVSTCLHWHSGDRQASYGPNWHPCRHASHFKNSAHPVMWIDLLWGYCLYLHCCSQWQSGRRVDYCSPITSQTRVFVVGFLYLWGLRENSTELPSVREIQFIYFLWPLIPCLVKAVRSPSQLA